MQTQAGVAGHCDVRAGSEAKTSPAPPLPSAKQHGWVSGRNRKGGGGHLELVPVVLQAVEHLTVHASHVVHALQLDPARLHARAPPPPSGGAHPPRTLQPLWPPCPLPAARAAASKQTHRDHRPPKE